jgi:hypothetical protein
VSLQRGDYYVDQAWVVVLVHQDAMAKEIAASLIITLKETLVITNKARAMEKGFVYRLINRYLAIKQENSGTLLLAHQASQSHRVSEHLPQGPKLRPELYPSSVRLLLLNLQSHPRVL